MIDKMKALIARLQEADKAYYGEDAPILSDREYVSLYDELAQLDKKT